MRITCIGIIIRDLVNLTGIIADAALPVNMVTHIVFSPSSTTNTIVITARTVLTIDFGFLCMYSPYIVPVNNALKVKPGK